MDGESEHDNDEGDNNSSTDDSLDLDDILPQVGEFGKYQKFMLWCICLPACIPCGFCAFNQLFMAKVPDHWCFIPELSNLTVGERKRIGIPFSENDTNDEVIDHCQRYAVNWSEIIGFFGGDQDGLSFLTPDQDWPKEPCLDGWEYDKSEVSSSIVIDFDLVCEKDIYPTLGLVALNLGAPIGVYFFGVLNDSIGRKRSFFSCLLVLITGSILTSLAQNYTWWALSRTVVGLSIPAIYQIPFIISLELVGPNYRSFVTVMTCMFYTCGLIILAGITYLVRDWVYLTLVTSVPFILYFLYWLILPESPRWLIAKGRFSEASEILEKLAKTNGKELPPGFTQLLRQKMSYKRNLSEEIAAKKGPGMMDLFATPNMRLKTLLITLNWLANGTVYVGLSYYGPALGDNEYLSFCLSSLVELPSYLACWLVMDKWGRRWPICICMIVSGSFCIATVLLPSDSVVTTLVFFLIAKSAISASFLIIYPFSGELYPTQVRGLGIGLSSYVSGLGLILIPFITYLGADMLVLPLIIMGSISILGGITTLRLPETLHYRLPQTLEEGEKFGKDFTLNDCCRCVPLKPEIPVAPSYEDLELSPIKVTENTSLQRPKIQRLVRQTSIMDTQKDRDGAMKLTYWF